MVRRISQTVLLAASFIMGALFATPTSAAPIYPMAIGKDVDSVVNQASFWGLPYPYGYRYRSYRYHHHHVRRPVRVRG